MSIRITTTIATQFVLVSLYGQNLVPNWSFEDHTLCPSAFNQVELATGWQKSLVNNVAPHHVDYFHSCGSGSFQAPDGFWGYQAPATGQAHMALSTKSPLAPNYRENMYAPLASPLIPGQSYVISLKVSHTDQSKGATNNIGIKLSTTTGFAVDNFSHLHASTVISDNVNWTLLRTTIVADSGYSYVGVGNFYTDANTTALTVCGTCPYVHNEYYIDDICVTPALDLGVDMDLCIGDELVLNAQAPGGTTTWSTGMTGPSMTVSQSGTYWARIEVDGCEVIDTIVVNAVQPPFIDLGPDTSICAGQSLVLDASAAGDVTYLWSNGSALSTLEVSTEGSYWVEVSSAGCSASDTFNLSTLPPVMIDLGSDTLLCEGDTITLDAVFTGTGMLWQDGSTGSTYDVTEPGTYWVTTQGCITGDTVHIGGAAAPVAEFTYSPTTIDPLEFEFINTGTANGSALWNFPTLTATGDTVTYKFIGNGLHTVCLTVTNECGSDSTCQEINIISTSTIDHDPILLYQVQNTLASDHIVVLSTNSEIGYRLFDTVGRCVKTYGTRGSNPIIELDVSDLAPGQYVLEGRSKQASTTTRVMVAR